MVKAKMDTEVLLDVKFRPQLGTRPAAGKRGKVSRTWDLSGPLGKPWRNMLACQAKAEEGVPEEAESWKRYHADPPLI